MYHRVARTTVDPWRLAITPANFEEQIRVLHERTELVRLADLRDRLRVGRCRKPLVALTFDDGYRDNLLVAKPLLERFGAPATVFVATGLVGQSRHFWWDRLALTCLSGAPLPRELSLSFNARTFMVEDHQLELPGQSGARARVRLHGSLWRHLSRMDATEREAVLRDIERWASTNAEPDSSALPMTEAELRQLVDGGLVEVGAHTVSHPLLSSLTRSEKYCEIEASRYQCMQLVGKMPDHFAFPNGDFDDESVALVRAAGFKLACNSNQDVVWRSGDPYRIPRITVRNESGERLWARLKWLWLA